MYGSTCSRTDLDSLATTTWAEGGVSSVMWIYSDTESDTESRHKELRTDTMSYILIRCR
jgi:hypothetical protein